MKIRDCGSEPNSGNKFDAITGASEPSNDRGQSGGEDHDPDNYGRDSEQEAAREGEVDKTTPTIATTTAATTGDSSPGMEGAWLWEHLQQHTDSWTAPQK